MTFASIRQAVAQWIAGTQSGGIVSAPEAPAPASAKQALPSLATWEPSMAGFRRFTGQSDLQSTLRDLSPLDQERQAQIGHYLYATNPLAKWLININVAYQLGGGVTLMAEDEAVQAVLDTFWHDPVNQWPVKLPQKIRDLGIFGEQCWPRFVAPGTGRVRIGYLDPTLIAQVVLDPDNAEQPIGIVTRSWTNYTEVPPRKYRVILGIDEEELTPLAQQLRREFTDGDCFYFAINKVSNGSRGISDLYDKADWLDGHEQFMFNRLERADLANRIVTDVTVTGATDAEIQERTKNFKLPPAGGAHLHNEKVVIEMKAPKLEAADASVDARMFRNLCLAGFPEHWVGGGGDVNRATAAEMDEPTFKLLEMAQTVTAHIIRTVATDQIRQAKRVGALRQSADESFDVQLPEMVKADLGKLAETFDKVSTAATTNVALGLMLKEEARQLIALTVKPLGIELKPMTEEELDELQAKRDLASASRDYQGEMGKVEAEAEKNTKAEKDNGKKAEGKSSSARQGYPEFDPNQPRNREGEWSGNESDMSTAGFWDKRRKDMEADLAANKAHAATKQGQIDRLRREEAALRLQRTDMGADTEAQEATLRADIARLNAELKQEQNASFLATWSRDSTVTRREQWNRRVRAGEFNNRAGKVDPAKVRAAEETQGWTFTELKWAIGLHELK